LAEEHKIWRSLLFIVSYLVLVIKTAEAVKAEAVKAEAVKRQMKGKTKVEPSCN